MLRTALLVALPCLPLAAQAAANVGDAVPEFSFPALLNGDGRQSLGEFFGSPIMLEYWGTH